MLCKLTKLIVLVLVISLVFMPVSMTFGSGIACLVALVGLAHIFDK